MRRGLIACGMVAAAMAASCAGPHGRVVTAERLSRLEGGGSLSTLWYYGSDPGYHYFVHLFKSSTPYRVRKEELRWEEERAFVGYRDGKHVVGEISRGFLESEGIFVLDETRSGTVFQILETRGGKDRGERWDVETRDGVIQIRKKRLDGKQHVPGDGVESWEREEGGEWRCRRGA